MQFSPGTIEVAGTPAEQEVAERLNSLLQQVDGLFGYRLPSCGVISDDLRPSFIIVSQEHGIVLLDVIDQTIVECSEDGEQWLVDDGQWKESSDVMLWKFQSEVETRLKQDTKLYNRKDQKMPVEISKAMIFVNHSLFGVGCKPSDWEADTLFLSKPNQLESFFESRRQSSPLSADVMDRIISNLDQTRRGDHTKKNVQRPCTMNDFINAAMSDIFKWDDIQRKIAYHIAPGPQRIRGLAGTGKTVVLTQKAAMAHKSYPKYKILYLFNTRSMYPQITKWITDDFIREAHAQPNLDQLHIRHAWGGISQPGLYSDLCEWFGFPRLTYDAVRRFADPPLKNTWSDRASRAH